jgi:hypothetical protein
LLELGIKFLRALRADAVAELGFGVVMDIDFHSVPVVLVVADLLAVHMDFETPARQLNL